jgi:hypothetical protein
MTALMLLANSVSRVYVLSERDVYLSKYGAGWFRETKATRSLFIADVVQFIYNFENEDSGAICVGKTCC